MNVFNVFQMLNDSVLIKKTFFSNAKLNIGLNIFDKAENGYHILESLIQEIDIKDKLKITIYKSNGKINLLCKGLKINCTNQKNSCYKITDYIKNHYEIKNKILIEINKTIPIGGGLGGSSSNAAAVLIFLDKYFNLNLSMNKKIIICKNIGMDVPFFLKGGLQYAENMGDITSAMPPLFKSYFFLIVCPKFKISTKWAYSKINKDLPGKKKNYNLLALEEPFNWTLFGNDFEEIVIPRYPEVRELKKVMLKNNAFFSNLSGSGSTVFGIYQNYDQAIKATKKIDHSKYQITVTTPIYR